MANAIRLKQVLDQMKKTDARGEPVPFSISFWTASQTRKTGGELISVEGAVLTRNIKNLKGFQRNKPNKKRVNEYQNNVRNIFVTEAKQFYKPYIWLIETFNGQQVTW